MRTPWHNRGLRMPALPLLLPLIQHQTKHIEPKLRELKTHCAELILRLVPEDMTPGRPKCRHGPPNRDVLLVRLLVHVPRIRDLPPRGRRRAVDLGVGEGFQCGEAQLVGQGVDFGVLEERGAGGVGGRERGIGLEGRVFGGGEAAWEVFAVVEVFENRACGREVVVWEVDAAVLRGRGVVSLGLVWLGGCAGLGSSAVGIPMSFALALLEEGWTRRPLGRRGRKGRR